MIVSPNFWDNLAGAARRLALGALLAAGLASASMAQQPPLEGPVAGQLVSPPDAITIDGWLLYPTLRFSSQYSNNLFQSPTNPLHAGSLGLSPALTAEWTDGIHRTSVYGNANGAYYPGHTELDTSDGQVGLIHSYAPLDDLIFRVQGDFTHQTFSNPLNSGIPGAITTPSSTLLPNGNTLLPNGSIISPTGQFVGQGIPNLSAGTATNVVNPLNQFTATAGVDKTFNRGELSFTTSISHSEYENHQFTPDFTSGTFSGHGAIWLHPLFYVYSDGTTSNRSDSSAYRALAGIGIGRPLEMFHGVIYYGHQGSEQDNAGSAGGDLFGASLLYDPLENWSVKAAFDETINESTQTGVSTIALSLPIPAPELIAQNVGTRIAASTLQSTYRFSPLWAVSGRFSYTHIDYFDSTRVDNAWLADAYVSYEMWRNMTLTWEYQYSSVTSNAPLISAYRHLVSMSAMYKF